MDVFQDLVIKGSRERLSNFVRYLGPPADSGWSRCPDLERELSTLDPSEGAGCCFLVAPRGDRPAAHLWLAFPHDRPDEMYVPNVVPSDTNLPLSRKHYNAIVQEFFRLVAMPAAERAGVSVTLSDPQSRVEDFAPPVVAKLLRGFSRLANRSTGSSASYDERRWFSFIIAAHLKRAPLDSHMLGRWLHEEEGWPEDRAEQLAIEYEQGRALLGQYRSRRPR